MDLGERVNIAFAEAVALDRTAAEVRRQWEAIGEVIYEVYSSPTNGWTGDIRCQLKKSITSGLQKSFLTSSKGREFQEKHRGKTKQKGYALKLAAAQSDWVSTKRNLIVSKINQLVDGRPLAGSHAELVHAPDAPADDEGDDEEDEEEEGPAVAAPETVDAPSAEAELADAPATTPTQNGPATDNLILPGVYDSPEYPVSLDAFDVRQHQPHSVLSMESVSSLSPWRALLGVRNFPSGDHPLDVPHAAGGPGLMDSSAGSDDNVTFVSMTSDFITQPEMLQAALHKAASNPAESFQLDGKLLPLFCQTLGLALAEPGTRVILQVKWPAAGDATENADTTIPEDLFAHMANGSPVSDVASRAASALRPVNAGVSAASSLASGSATASSSKSSGRRLRGQAYLVAGEDPTNAVSPKRTRL
jgi:hypothetical protein